MKCGESKTTVVTEKCDESQKDDPSCGLKYTETTTVHGCCDECTDPQVECTENKTCVERQYESSTNQGSTDGCCCEDGKLYDEVTKSCVKPENCGCVYNVSGEYKSFPPMESPTTYKPKDCPVYNVDYDTKYIHSCVCICEDGKLDCNYTTCTDDMGKLREPEEVWDDPDHNCYVKTCEGDGSVKTEKKPEPKFCEDIYKKCEKEGKRVSETTVDEETCCYACEERCEKKDTEDTIEYENEKGIKCVSTKKEVIEYCTGNCGDSGVMMDLSAFNGAKTSMKLTTCRCCQGELIDKEVEFRCEDNSITKLSLPILASNCACSDCPEAKAAT